MDFKPILMLGVLAVLAAFGECSSDALGAERADAWPFLGPQQVKLPKVADIQWVRNDIDAFILASLQQQKLTPAPEATRRTLIRRLYFDLIGLPPTPEQIEAFVQDKSPNAYDELVDRLLKDPRYGERWARFWLDLARYADTAGYEGDPDLPHAWRYRDYVIDAFNDDKPYDVFIKEQIAGDEFAEISGAGDLPGVKPERVVALTFLRLAPFTEPRGDETRHEMLSEMTSTIGSVFLGLTVGCAKCHDHKYDEIPTKDFYRLKAFLSTIQIPRPEPGDIYQIGGSLAASFYRSSEKEWAQRRRDAFAKEIVDSKQQFAELKSKLEKRLNVGGGGFALQGEGGKLGNNYVYDEANTSDGRLHFTIANGDGNAWQFFTDGPQPSKLGALAGSNRGQWFADLNAAQHVSLGQYTGGTGQPKGDSYRGHFAEVLIYSQPLELKERQAIADYVEQKYGKGVANDPPRKGLRFWLDAADLDANEKTSNPASGSSVGAWIDKVGRLKLMQSDTGKQPVLAAVDDTQSPAVRFDDDFLVGDVSGASFLSDQSGSLVIIYASDENVSEGYGFTVGGGGEHLSMAVSSKRKTNNLARAIADENNSRVSKEERRLYDHLANREPFIRQQLKRLQPVAMSLRHSYGPPYEPGVPTSRVMIRGEYDNPGDVVEAGFLSAITGHEQSAKIRLDPFKRWPTRSRRMTLANWIASGDNPLTARVMVNRLWHWHFGRGLVATPSDFGQLSDGSSHPQLLDWLALKFVEKKWSIKEMHRLIVTSAAYRQSSKIENSAASTIDPDNKLLWRFRRRRLEAEAVRDSVLAVSGRLSTERNGLPIFPPLPGGIAEAVKYDNSKWNTQYGAEGRKRSIYIYQQRTLTMPLMQAFDALVCDQSRPRRHASITPLQALAMYNGAFVNEEAKHFAARVLKDSGDDVNTQIDRAFRLAMGRPASDEETERLRQFMADTADGPSSMIGLCRILFNSNEFLHVD